MSEVAFLAMDLEKHGCPEFASVCFNRYLESHWRLRRAESFSVVSRLSSVSWSEGCWVRLAQLAESGQEVKKPKEELFTQEEELNITSVDSTDPESMVFPYVN